jgi:hypothetical protein
MNGDLWWVKLIYNVGVPSAIAIFLVYMMASRIDSIIEETGRQVSSNTSVINANTASINAILAQQRDIERLLQRICINTAVDNTARNACFQ